MKKFLIIAMFLYAAAVSAVSFRDFQPKAFDFQVSPAEREALLPDAVPFLSRVWIVSGISPTALESWTLRYQNLLQEARGRIKGRSSYETADEVLKFLHAKVLKNYESKQTLIPLALDQGKFNCVSSSLLYNLIMTDLGLKTRGILLSDHVFSQVLIQGEWVDAETTVAFGFDAGKRKEATDHFQKVTGYVYVPSSKLGRSAVVISNEDYLALTYSNRGVTTLETGKFSEALGMFLKAVILFPEFQEGLLNLQAGYTQYSIALLQTNHFEEAEKVILESLELFPGLDKAVHNRKVLYLSWIQWSLKQKGYSKALEILKNRKSDFSLEEQENLYLLYLQTLFLQDGKPVEALEESGRLKQENPSFTRIGDYQNYMLYTYVQQLKKEGKEPEALKILDRFRSADNPEALLTEALELSRLGKPEKAQELLLESLRKKYSSDAARALMQIAYENLTQRQNLKLAQEIALNLTPWLSQDINLGKYLGDYFKNLAYVFLKNGKTDEGIRMLLEFARFPELSRSAYQSAGDLYYQVKVYPLMRNRNYAGAAEALEKGIEITRKQSPSLVEAHKNALINYGVALYQDKKIAESYRVYVRILSLYAGDSAAVKNFRTISAAYLKELQGTKEFQKVQEEVRKILGK